MLPKKLMAAMLAIVITTVAGLCVMQFCNASADIDANTIAQKTLSFADRNSVKSVTNQLANQTGAQSTQQNSSQAPSGDWADLRPIAKELSKYIPYYRQAKNVATANTITIEFEGTTRTMNNARGTIRADCSGGVSAMLYFMGVDRRYTGFNSNAFSTYGNNVNASTFADLEVGDILVAPGSHVAMVAYKDDNKVYTFDWGKTEAIRNCESKGWDESYSLTSSVRNWRSHSMVVRRPIRP